MFNCFAKMLSGNKQDNPTQAMLFGLFTFWTIPMHNTQMGWIPTQPTIVDPSSIRDRRVNLVDKCKKKIGGQILFYDIEPYVSNINF